MGGTLYIVPTPVGNLDDMTFRAIEILKNVSVIFAEDTRTSSALLRHFGISTPMRSHHKFNEHHSVDGVINLLQNGDDVALISDAGTPGISDPGFLVSRACRQHNLRVITLPGPTAFVPALVNSGLPCERFCFQGFLPLKKGRRTRLAEIAELPFTSIIYESPIRLAKTLKDLSDVCGEDREASVSREISKKFEECQRDSLKQLHEHYEKNPPKGEIVIVVAGKSQTERTEHKNKYKR